MHSVAEFASEAFESITHADSRLWRTLWLLISKPGFLTKEFVEGRRARYLPPFRLYLVLSVLLFLVVPLISQDAKVVGDAPTDGKILPKKIDVPVETIPQAPTVSKEERARKTCENAKFDVPASWIPRLKAACRKVLSDDGHAYAEAMVHNIPRALFLLIPLLALVMRAMYRRRYYVEHLLFFIHNHAFTFVLFTVLLLATAVIGIGSGWLVALFVFVVLFYPPIYTYKAMRRVYAQGRWVTRLKFSALALSYLTLMFLLSVFTALYSLVTL